MQFKPKLKPQREGSIALIVVAIFVIVCVILAVLLFGYNIIPLQSDDSEFCIFLCDTHIGRGNSQRNLEIAIDSINEMEPKPELVIIAGDLVDWGEGLTSELNWKRFKAIMTTLDVPYLVVPGNHDYRYAQQLTPPYSLTNYHYYIGSSEDYTYDYKDFHFIFMNTGPDYWDITATPKGAGLTNSQIQWLESDLKENSNKTIMIVMHHPAQGRGDTGIGCIANNREDFIQLCLDYDVYAVLSGHTHLDWNFDYLGNKYDVDSRGTQFTTTLSVLESVGYRKFPLDNNYLPDKLDSSHSFNWDYAVEEPVGDYYGDG